MRVELSPIRRVRLLVTPQDAVLDVVEPVHDPPDAVARVLVIVQPLVEVRGWARHHKPA